MNQKGEKIRDSKLEKSYISQMLIFLKEYNATINKIYLIKFYMGHFEKMDQKKLEM